MAYKNTEHDYKKLERDMAEGRLDDLKAILLYGHEDYLVKNYEKRIRELYVEPAAAELDFVMLEGVDVTVDDIVSHCDTLPMLSRKRVVAINNHPALMPSSKTSELKKADDSDLTDEDIKNDIKSLADYLEDIPESALIIFVCSSVDTRKMLSKKIIKTGKSYDFKRLDRKDMASFIKKRFRGEGKHADDAVVREIINTTGYFDRDSDYDLNGIAGDVVKIASFSQGSEVTSADVSSVLSTTLETDAFALLDSLSRGDKSESMLLINNIIGTGESSFRLLGLIISQFELMLGIKEFSMQNMDKKEIMNELGVNSEFRYRKVSGFTGNFSVDKLNDILKKLYEVEKNIKTGIYNEKLAMTMFVAEV